MESTIVEAEVMVNGNEALAIAEASQQLTSLTEYRDAILKLQGSINARAMMIGKMLEDVAVILQNNKMGGLETWVERQLNWDRRTGYNYRQVWKRYGDTELGKRISQLTMPLTGLYELAAPSTPQEAVEDVIEAAERGEQLTLKFIREHIRRSKKSSYKPNALPAHEEDDDTEQPDSYTFGGVLQETFCLFCRKSGKVIYGVGDSQQGICGDCCEDGLAHITQMKADGFEDREE